MAQEENMISIPITLISKYINMKRLLIAVFVTLLSVSMSAQIGFAAYFDGYWSDWKSYSQDKWSIRGSYAGFIIYQKESGPWEPWFKFTINNFYMPDAKTRKWNVKYRQWYEFTGTVEYYICDDYLSAYELFKTMRGASLVPPNLPDGRPTKKVTSQAKIKIAPYKDHPTVYNIWYDNVGLAINLNNIYF